MSDRFWDRHLSYLRPDHQKSTKGITGRNGNFVHRVQMMAPDPDAGMSTDAKLRRELEQQIKERNNR